MRILLIILMIFVVIAAYILGGWMTIWLSKVTIFTDVTDNDGNNLFKQNIGCLFCWPIVLIILIPYSLYYFIKSSFMFCCNIVFGTSKKIRKDDYQFEDEKKIEIDDI